MGALRVVAQSARRGLLTRRCYLQLRAATLLLLACRRWYLIESVAANRLALAAPAGRLEGPAANGGRAAECMGCLGSRRRCVALPLPGGAVFEGPATRSGRPA